MLQSTTRFLIVSPLSSLTDILRAEPKIFKNCKRWNSKQTSYPVREDDKMAESLTFRVKRHTSFYDSLESF
ncbi:Hypothetical predicted protein [Octopus vulgaris]|uniref:Uncharacterized protein n=1 Tax=Octopus vulgaris TaxID=6645 RepID=A0AA36BC69_OCTVU|nr:Hypothetical predicted protein [Octopus vulgaris]